MLNEILNAYDWFDHRDGPKFVETHRDQYRTSGHWLFLPGAKSYFHKVLNNDELWLIHSGHLLIHLLGPDGTYQLFQLGTNYVEGDRPVISIPAGTWQAAEIPAGIPFAFGSNVCAPAFSYDQFELGKRDVLVKEFPKYADLIRRLAAEN
ncbi:MAG: cupin domain-containing protein [Methanothrix sp.]|nr:cupin domain-containing protein [Methanothrix sp.]